MFLANEILKCKIPFVFQTSGTVSDAPFGPRGCGRQDGVGSGGQAECARVCGVGARVAEVGGGAQAPLCLGSCGSGRLPLNPRASPQGLHCKRVPGLSSWLSPAPGRAGSASWLKIVCRIFFYHSSLSILGLAPRVVLCFFFEFYM